MASLYRSDTIRPNGSRYVEASTTPDKDDDDNKTIRSIHDMSQDAALFEFTDFELDLSCLSTPPSPAASTSNLPPDTPSPPPSPQPQLSRATSFTTSYVSQTIVKKPSKKLSIPKFVSLPSSSNGTRGSWPLVKYAGRGTPIDRTRRMEWGGSISESEEVGEDGVLFSAVRSTSLESASRPSQRSARSVTPEWSYLSPLSSVRSRSPESNSHSRSEASLHEQAPELAPIAIEDEWDSIIQSVLGSKTSEPSSSSSASETQQSSEADADAQPQQQKRRLVPVVEFPMMSPEQIRQLNTGLEIDLGIDKALDLGLGPRGMNLINLGLLPSSASGRDTPSMYSQPNTPRESPPPSVRHQHFKQEEAEQEVELETPPPEHASPTSMKAADHDQVLFEPKTEGYPWWRKVLYRLRKMQNVMHHNRRRF